MHGRPRSYKHQLRDPGAQESYKRKVDAIRAGTALVLQQRKAQTYNQAVLDASAKLLKVVPEIYTLWNFRREALLPLLAAGGEAAVEACKQELALTQACLFENPKSYSTWHHRKWVVARGLVDLQAEVKLVEKALQADDRNFHAWAYRQFIVRLSECPLHQELAFSEDKIAANFSNYSAWHYRAILLHRLHCAPSGTSAANTSSPAATHSSASQPGVDASTPLGLNAGAAPAAAAAAAAPAPAAATGTGTSGSDSAAPHAAAEAAAGVPPSPLSPGSPHARAHGGSSGAATGAAAAQPAVQASSLHAVDRSLAAELQSLTMTVDSQRALDPAPAAQPRSGGGDGTAGFSPVGGFQGSATQTQPIPTQVLDEEYDMVHQAFATDCKDQSPWMYYRWLVGNSLAHAEPRGRGAEEMADARAVLEAVLCREVQRMEDDHVAADPHAKWPLLTLARLKEAQARLGLCGGRAAEAVAAEARGLYQQLVQLDPLRAGYYQDAVAGKAFVIVSSLGTV